MPRSDRTQANASNSYMKLVTAEIGKAELVLKLVNTPEDMLEDTVRSRMFTRLRCPC